jgi:hypothetical protein
VGLALTVQQEPAVVLLLSRAREADQLRPGQSGAGQQRPGQSGAGQQLGEVVLELLIGVQVLPVDGIVDPAQGDQDLGPML